MQFISSIEPVLDHYDAFIIDLWGVIHDGTALYPGVREALQRIADQRKSIIFLSNAPRKAEKAIAGLDQLGIARSHYITVITSGQVAYEKLKGEHSLGDCYYYLGPGKDEDVLNGLNYRTTHNPAEADFILNAGFEYDFQPEAEIEPVLQNLKSHGLPLLCINPDMEVVKQDGTRMLCAGWVASRYAALGGAVQYIGKPHPHVYEACMKQLQAQPSRILATGDNLQTDIRGANRMGFDSLLIAGGILKSEYGGNPSEKQLRSAAEHAMVSPTYCAANFAL